VELVKPKILFFENVKGFTLEFDKNSTKGKRYSDYVIRKLERVGYNVHPELINFSDYGIPQKRCRFILVGIRNDIAYKNKISATNFFGDLKNKRKEFLIQKGLELSVPLEAAISDLLMSNGTAPSPDNKSFKAGLYSKTQSKYQAFMRKEIPAENIIADSHRFANHSLKIKERFNYILKNAPKGKSLNKQFKQDHSIKKHTLIPLNCSDQAPTITTLPDDYVHYSEPRILTVREYARIQGFPDSFEVKGKYTTGGKARVLEVPRYTQIGNAIPPLFGEQCGIVLKSLISNG
jgi:DNA (cytosine-5)-methyltransferase 1